MTIKELYNRIKLFIKNNPNYEVVCEEDFHSLFNIRIDDDHKELILEFYKKSDAVGKFV